MFTVYAVYKNADMTEGRGPMILDKVFNTEPMANDYAMQQTGVMGRKPADFQSDSWRGMGDWVVKPIVVHEMMSEVPEVQRTQVREKALQKLTPEERRALDLE